MKRLSRKFRNDEKKRKRKGMLIPHGQRAEATTPTVNWRHRKSSTHQKFLSHTLSSFPQDRKEENEGRK